MTASTLFVSGEATAGDLLIGALGGLCGAAGVGLLYQGLAVGQMSVIAPITALLTAAVPLVAGYLEGERPGTAAVLGMALALVAIVLVSDRKARRGGAGCSVPRRLLPAHRVRLGAPMHGICASMPRTSG